MTFGISSECDLQYFPLLQEQHNASERHAQPTKLQFEDPPGSKPQNLSATNTENAEITSESSVIDQDSFFTWNESTWRLRLNKIKLARQENKEEKKEREELAVFRKVHVVSKEESSESEQEESEPEASVSNLEFPGAETPLSDANKQETRRYPDVTDEFFAEWNRMAYQSSKRIGL